jgi:hypothetical protein
MTSKNKVLRENTPVDIEETKHNPERQLLAEVLLGAIRDILNNTTDSEAQKIRREALEWFNKSSIKPFSFVWICQSLDLEPKTIRRVVGDMLQRGSFFKF